VNSNGYLAADVFGGKNLPPGSIHSAADTVRNAAPHGGQRS
jgi:hypothetical protein